MRSPTSILFFLFLIVMSGCGPAPKDTSFITTTEGAESVQPSPQATTSYLPAINGGGAQVAETTPDKQEWLRYNHAYWGISFQYPTGWSVDVPDLELGEEEPSSEYTNNPNMDIASTWGHSITLIPPKDIAKDATKIEISLQGYTLSPGTNLEEWVKIDADFDEQFGMPPGSEPIVHTLSSLPTDDMPQGVDQGIIDVMNTNLATTIWLSKSGLVYGIAIFNANESRIEIAKSIVRSFEFNPKAQERLLRAPYNGDEKAMLATMEELSPKSPDVAAPAQSDSVSIAVVRPTMTQLALPADWISSLDLTGTNLLNVECGSPYHINAAEFALLCSSE